MDFHEVLDYLYNSLPVFQNAGRKAFNKSLDKTLLLLDHLGNPHLDFKSIHVGGTNGKGTTSHMLASIFQVSGYKTGLYTSPHLKRFTERIKINGKEAEDSFIIDFVVENRKFIEELKPSFFEVTVGMAFKYFSEKKVDIAIIEVGMGGRLDSTNVIIPELSIITSISFDHQQYLGNTIELIAGEKAGIIKKGIPVVIGKVPNEAMEVFEKESKLKDAVIIKTTQEDLNIKTDLKGDYIKLNVKCVLKAIDVLKDKFKLITEEKVKFALANTIETTGLKGRWQFLGSNPLIICDTGHNKEAFEITLKQIQKHEFNKLWMIIGMVEDKDHDSILELFPKNANYIFSKPSVLRGLKADILAEIAKPFGLTGTVIENVNDALKFAKENSTENDLVFIGGSTFLVADIDEL